MISIDPAQHYCVAYSGGLDSHALLHLLAKQHAIIRAVHVNHGLSENALQWVEHCKQVCAELNIDLTVISIEVKPKKGESLEAVARTLRYQKIFSQLQTGEILLTAHNQNDQAETLLLQLLRGAGPKGLSAMPEISERHHRPILNYSRAEIVDYANQHQLLWIEDESNQNLSFNRNFIRHQIMPKLTERWPSAHKTIARSAVLCAEGAELLYDLAEIDSITVLNQKSNTLIISNLNKLGAPRQANLLRYWLQYLGLPLPSQIKIKQIQQEVMLAREDAMPLVHWPGAEVRRYRGELYAMPPLAEHDASFECAWQTDQPLSLPGNQQPISCVDLIRLNDNLGQYTTLTVRYRQGDKKIKKLLQKQGIPPWLRDRVPLFYAGDLLLAYIKPK